MTLFERVQTLIKEQGLTIKQVERECGLANATIRRWETQTPNITSVQKVAHLLHVSIDYLVDGSSSFTNSNIPVCDGISLDESEIEIVAMYRVLDARGKEDLLDYLTMKYRKAIGESESAYSGYTGPEERIADDPPAGGNLTSGIA